MLKTSTRLDYNEVMEARKRGLEALQRGVIMTTNPFLIAMADGGQLTAESKPINERPKRKKRASFKIK